MNKKNFFFLSFTTLFSLTLFFSSLLLALTHAALLDCTQYSHSGTSLLFSPSSLAKWPLYLFLYLFLLFFLPHSSHQVTINTSHLVRLCFHQNLFLQLSLAEWPLPVSFLLSSACATHCGSLLIKRSQTSHKSWSESSDMLIK